MTSGLDKKAISERNKKGLMQLESELIFKLTQSDFNPKGIVKGHYPLYFSNRKILNPYIVEALDEILEKYGQKAE